MKKSILIITNLFPNKENPNLSPFNFQQIKALSTFCDLKVIAPLPHFAYSKNKVPCHEIIDNISVYHPRYLVIPKFFRFTYGFFYFLGIFNTVKLLLKTIKFDCIFVTWAYPDAFGVSLISQIFNIPFFVKTHGSDINFASNYFLRAEMIKYAINKSKAVFAPSKKLISKMIDMGIDNKKLIHLPNGVNIEKFKPMNKYECRKKTNIPKNQKHVLFIGNLTEVKGLNFLIDAFKLIEKDIFLTVIGTGKLKAKYQKHISKLNLQNRITFKGKINHSEIPIWMNTTDVLCLPSLNEGSPNVILEALSCNTFVIATKVGGIPEIIEDENQGIVISSKNHKEIAKAISKVFKTNIHNSGKKILSWNESAKNLYSTLTNKI